MAAGDHESRDAVLHLPVEVVSNCCQEADNLEIVVDDCHVQGVALGVLVSAVDVGTSLG